MPIWSYLSYILQLEVTYMRAIGVLALFQFYFRTKACNLTECGSRQNSDSTFYLSSLFSL